MPAPNSPDPRNANPVDLTAACPEACAELQRLIQQGESLATEAVLQQFPDLLSNRDAQLELIYLEFVMLKELGKATDGAALCRRFPHLTTDIRMLMEVDSAVNWSPASTTSVMEVRHSAMDTPRALSLPTNLSANRDRIEPVSVTASLPIDTGFSDYQILERIGNGGMGIVYRARQLSLNRIVAIKTINIASSIHPALLQRFQAEAELSAKLQHPNIVQIYAIGENDGVPYFSMEFVPGPNLGEAIAQRPLEPNVAAQLVSTLARAIHYAHTQGIIHRDLKPTNILLAPIDQQSPQGEGWSYTPKIADFGLGRFSHETSRQTHSSTLLGTPSYMAPEQISDQENVGPVSDIYSLGAILYTLLVGRPPFHAASLLETLRQVQHEDPTALRKINSRLPRDLETICLTCLRKEPQSRYLSAELLSADLQRFLNNQPIAARPVSALERTWKWACRHPSLATLILALLCSSMIMTGLWWQATASQLAEVEQRERAERLNADREMQHAQREYEASNIDGCQQLLDACEPAFRHWEWHHLNDLCNQAVWQSPRQSQAALTVDITQDGKLGAIGYGRWGFDAPQEIHVWDLEHQQLKHTLTGHPECSVQDVHFSPDGKLLLSAAMSWNTQEDSEYGGVILWNLETGKPRYRFPKINAMIARFHRDGQTFYIGTSQGTVTEHSLTDGKLIRTYRGRNRGQLSQMILALDIDFDTHQMAATSRGGDLAIWKLGESEPAYFLSDMGDLRQVRLMPDGRQVMVGGYLGNREWFQFGGGQLHSLHRDSVEAIPYTAFSPDGQLQVTSVFGQGIDIRELSTGKLVRRIHCHLGHVRDMAFDGAGTRLLTCGHDGRAMLWDTLENNQHPVRISLAGRVSAMVWCPTNNEFAFTVQENPARGARSLGSPRAEIRDPATLASNATIKLPSIASCINYTTDGESLLLGLTDHSAQVWRKENREPTCTFSGHTAKILSIANTHDTSDVVSIDETGNVCQWSSVDGRLVTQKRVAHAVRLADFSPDRPLLAWIGDDNRVNVWNVRHIRTVATLPEMQQVRHLKFSHDGQYLGVAFEEMVDALSRPCVNIYQVNDLVSGNRNQPLSRLTGHLARISGFSFSPDNQRIVTISDDETVRLFDVTLGCEIHLLDTEKGNDGVVLFGRDGKHIVRSRSNELASWGTDRKNGHHQLTADENLAQLKKWHQSQVATAARRQQWRAARFHASALVEMGENQFLYRRGLYNLYDNRWHEAEEDLQRSVERSSGVSELCTLARIKLKLEKFDEYTEQCQRLCDHLNNPNCSDDEVNSIAWTVCLTNNFQAPYESLAAKLTQATSKQKRATYYNTLALVQLRAGKYDDAVKAAELSLKLDRDASAPFDWLFLELCRQRKNHSGESVLNERAVEDRTTTTRVAQDNKANVNYMTRVRTWLEVEENKARQRKVQSTAFAQTRHLEIPLFLKEIERQE